MPDGRKITGIVESTLGRFLFNEIIPQDLGFVDRSIPGNELKLGGRFPRSKEADKQILEKVINTHGATRLPRYWMLSRRSVTNTPPERL